MTKLQSCSVCRTAGFSAGLTFQCISRRLRFVLLPWLIAIRRLAATTLKQLFLEWTKDRGSYNATLCCQQWSTFSTRRRDLMWALATASNELHVLQYLLNPCWPKWETALSMERNAKWPLIKHSSIPPVSKPPTPTALLTPVENSLGHYSLLSKPVTASRRSCQD